MADITFQDGGKTKNWLDRILRKHLKNDRKLDSKVRGLGNPPRTRQPRSSSPLPPCSALIALVYSPCTGCTISFLRCRSLVNVWAPTSFFFLLPFGVRFQFPFIVFLLFYPILFIYFSLIHLPPHCFVFFYSAISPLHSVFPFPLGFFPVCFFFLDGLRQDTGGSRSERYLGLG